MIHSLPGALIRATAPLGAGLRKEAGGGGRSPSADEPSALQGPGWIESLMPLVIYLLPQLVHALGFSFPFFHFPLFIFYILFIHAE